MFLVNGMKATLRQFNRKDNSEVFDDQNYKDIPIKICPYDGDVSISFGKYSVPEATGYYIVPRYVDVREGDQITFLGNKLDKNFVNHTFTILKVTDEWLFNRVENKIIAIK